MSWAHGANMPRTHMLAIALIPSGGCPLVAEATCTSACHTSLEATVGESKR